MKKQEFMIAYAMGGKTWPVRLVVNASRTFELVAKERASTFSSSEEAAAKAVEHGINRKNFTVVPA